MQLTGLASVHLYSGSSAKSTVQSRSTNFSVVDRWAFTAAARSFVIVWKVGSHGEGEGVGGRIGGDTCSCLFMRGVENLQGPKASLSAVSAVSSAL